MDVLNFSFDDLRQRIYDPRTRKYFDEVYKCYANKCYRSSMVMLWSVIVCDLLFKLQELKEIYSDDAAQKILIKIEKLRSVNPYSSQWEKDLIDLVFTRTHLLDTASKHILDSIMQTRHLSAHPVINEDNKLFEPSADMAKSNIRNCVDFLFAKPPFLSQKILNTLLGDLEEIKDIFPSNDKLKIYLNSKYFNALNGVVVAKIFRGLWKMVFKLDNEQTEKNRDINYRTLSILYEKEKEIIENSIKDESNFYSDIKNDKKILERLILFLSLKQTIYLALTDSTKEVIQQACESRLTNFAIAFFLPDSSSVEDHLTDLIKKINENSSYGDRGFSIKIEQLNFIKSICFELNISDLYRKLGITCYIHSSDYDCADMCFERFISPNLNDYTDEEFNLLLEGSNANSQVYDRRKSRIDDFSVLKKVQEKYPHIGISKYTNLPVDRISKLLDDKS